MVQIATRPPLPSPIKVTYQGLQSQQSTEFTQLFRIGRGSECEVCIPHDFVSRFHAEVVPVGGSWQIRDLQSSNGIFCNGKKVNSTLITSGLVVRLGIEGPEISFTFPVATHGPVLAKDDPRKSEEIAEQYVKRYFGEPRSDEPIGEHTMYIRRAFSNIQSVQRRKHTRQRWVFSGVILVLLLASIIASIYALRWKRETLRQRAIARELFYSMKSLDVEIAEAERQVLASDKQHGAEVVNKYEARRQELRKNYDQFLATLHVYDPKSTEQHRLILRVARMFGECELDMPPDFEQEVMRYINLWKSTGRFSRDIRLSKQKGYTRTIPVALLARGLPEQFFYLAMQESDFDTYASGHMTRMGIAKGMWQFIPETGVKFGLHLGPLVDVARPDPRDERDQADKSTIAASLYLQTLYSTDAQASGLLVMACYNWGEGQILPLVRRMPANPRERNFWRLLSEHRNQIPQQTYDYVFYITSAAVIGENPRLFGFDFDNPLDDRFK